MKIALIASMMIFFSTAFAAEIKVSSMKNVEGMDRSYQLKTNLPDKVTLDCQSFIQGLTFQENENRSFYLMESQECESLAANMRESFKKHAKHCFEIDSEVRSDYACH
jgi:hypothetical protein